MKYYLTQAGALFLETKSKTLVPGKGWYQSGHETRVAKKPFGHGVTRTRKPAPNMVLRSPAPGQPKKWMKKPTKGST